MEQIALTRIVYLQNILGYAFGNSKELITSRLVNSGWNECIMIYSEDTWKKAYKKELDEDKNTLLHICIRKKGSMNMIYLLSSCEENMNVMNKYKNTPLHYACCNGHTECVK